MKDQGVKNLDAKELEFPETVFSRDIETRVIQVIILHCLSKIEGVGLQGGNLIDALFGREVERVKGIYVEQDTKNHLVKVKVEVNIIYGVAIPEKTEEIQSKIVGEISGLTGLHVAAVHVVIRGLSSPRDREAQSSKKMTDEFLSSEDFPEELLIKDESIEN
ncbi:Uncharacterized protein CLAVI_000078 [Candidatus Clavichlamydia salmonicola]|uniref:Asp23/Gls24 family envelope stress response protein n=1 Tax=Candidatus Clavichlamydia salmonicola TaxID=469812 RepID=UPI0018918A1F|nr:Asp23/Gls24 family envelope stress response protein [Candidatus Clavichlamydia salmonicola]MBF5050473.1 Uncharacterized protein [Candidatus Clavichlamydia salmonicola]